MNFFEKIVHAFSADMPKPSMYGWFHIMFLVLTIGLTVFLCLKCRDCKAKTFKWIVASAWIVMLVLEIYKQIDFSFHFVEELGGGYWDYQWYAFPYQLCSTPLYVLPLVAFCKQGKFRDSCMAYISTFALFGGLVTMIFPATVFVETIGINIQTMTHHGLQIVLGIFILVHERKRLDFKFFLRAIYVFGVAMAIAMVLNLSVHAGITEEFNMFYISPYFPCSLPLLDLIYAKTPYAVFLLIYIIGFVLAALAIYYIQYGFIRLGQNLKKKAEAKRNSQNLLAIEGQSSEMDDKQNE